jgi:hypothetical protein
MGVHVVPEFSVFQTPPEPIAMYHRFSFSEEIAISAILPDVSAGPRFLNDNSLNVSDVNVWAFMGISIPKRKNHKIDN